MPDNGDNPANPAQWIGDLAANVFNTGAEIVSQVIEDPSAITDEVHTKITGLLTLVEDHVGSVLTSVQTVITAPPLPPPPPPLPPPVDPVATLEQLSVALANAETTLNRAGLTIAGASLEISMTVKLPGESVGAGATMKIQLNPTPEI